MIYITTEEESKVQLNSVTIWREMPKDVNTTNVLGIVMQITYNGKTYDVLEPTDTGYVVMDMANGEIDTFVFQEYQQAIGER